MAFTRSRNSGALLLSLTLLLGCSADDTIADPARSQEDRLRPRIDGFCESECERIAACPESSTTADNCQSECRSLFRSTYIGQGDACAQLGLDLMECVSDTACEKMEDEPCEPILERSEPCEPGDSGEPPSGNPAVTCQSGFGSGSAGGAAMPTPTCDQGWDDCSDGQQYRVICLPDGAQSAACTCYVQQQPTLSFPSASMSCPSTEELNAGCGWFLAVN